VISITNNKVENVVPAIAVVKKIARMRDPIIELPPAIQKEINVGDECTMMIEKTSTQTIIKLMFDINQIHEEKEEESE